MSWDVQCLLAQTYTTGREAELLSVSKGGILVALHFISVKVIVFNI